MTNLDWSVDHYQSTNSAQKQTNGVMKVRQTLLGRNPVRQQTLKGDKRYTRHAVTFY